MSIGTWKKTHTHTLPPPPLLLPVRFGSIVVNFFRFAQMRILPVRTEPIGGRVPGPPPVGRVPGRGPGPPPVGRVPRPWARSPARGPSEG